MTEQNRLLTPEEADIAIHTTYADFPTWYRVAQAQDAKTRQMTLREV
ncbi:unnamed protein product, partial [marine sediment metagenome]